jgi:hypothetical protein
MFRSKRWTAFTLRRLRISPEFLRQDVPDPSVLDKQIDPTRPLGVSGCPERALARVADSGNLQRSSGLQRRTRRHAQARHQGHNLPEQKQRDVQPLRSARGASHRFPKVNSAHHQAIDQLGDDLEVEAWAAHDGIIEQVRLRKYPFGLASNITRAQPNLRFVVRRFLRAIAIAKP